MPTPALKLDEKDDCRLIAEIERRLGAATTSLSLPRRLAGALWSFLLPEVYKPPVPIGPPSRPCKAMAGSEERIRAYEKRHEDRRSIFSKRDKQMPKLPEGVNHGHRGHSQEEMDRAFREEPTPGDTEIASLDDVLQNWQDILGRDPGSMARQIRKLRSDLAEMATTVLQLRDQLKKVTPKKPKATKAGKVWHVSRGYRPPKEHPEIPFGAALDTTDLVEEDEIEDAPSWQVSSGQLCGVAS